MPTKKAQGRNFCFTHNNYKAGDIEALMGADWISYGCVGKEVGESGTPHLQGYIQLKKGMRITEVNVAKRLKKLFEKQPAVFIAKGTVEQNQTYCSKQASEEEDDEKYFEWGEARGKKTQGTRSDIAKFKDAVVEGKDDLTLAEEFPGEFMKYYKAADRLRKSLKKAQGETAMKEAYKNVTLRDWQEKLVKHVEEQNDRQVTWVIDPKGNSGKSWLANWLYVHKGAFIVDGGKQADIAHAYDCQEWVVFDYTRSQEEYINYQVIESFKNGRIFSPKYDSAMKIFKPAKLIVFANWAPDYKALSEDRWDIMDMSAETDEAKYIRETLRRAPAWGVFAEYEPEEEREKRSTL